MPQRNVLTIDDLTNSEIERIFALADEYLEKMKDPVTPYRLRGRLSEAEQFVASTLFYEPSTRTKFSFETAMIRLGGNIVSNADPATTSAAKGESLADTVRVLQNYTDMIIIRHPCEGAARLAADFCDVPVVNAGDGSHEHPTQTLCDLYTLKRERGELAGMNVLICGDLKNGRTIHSLVYALARFGANILPSPAPGLDLPQHVIDRLQADYGCVPIKSRKRDTSDLPVDVVYVTPEESHQQALFPHFRANGSKISFQKKEFFSQNQNIDVCYVTRLQKERMLPEDNHKAYPVINKKFLEEKRFAQTKVLHPLPRVDELGYDLDKDPRGAYFKQAAYGVPIRMALIASLLNINKGILGPQRVDENKELYIRSDIGMLCPNVDRCISHNEREQKHLSHKFWILRNRASSGKPDLPFTVRCYYCEHHIMPKAIGDQHTRKYYLDSSVFPDLSLQDIVLFKDENEAQEYKFVHAGVNAEDTSHIVGANT